MKTRTEKNNSAEEIEKREKLVSGLIIVTAIIVGVLITVLISGLLDSVN